MSRRMRRKPSPSADGGVATHVDPALADPASTAVMPSVLLAQQLFHRPEAADMTAAAAIGIPQLTKEPDVAAITAEVSRVFATGGDAAVQARLMQEIQRTKKLESEVATARKKSDAAAREKDAQVIEYTKSCATRDTLKATCGALLKEIERLDLTVKSKLDSDSTRRDDIRVRIESEIESVTTRLDEQLVTKRQLDEENVTLREELATLRADFEAKFDGYQSVWKEREAATKQAIAALSDASTRTALLKETVRQKELTLRELQMNSASLTGQLDLYRSRFTEFEQVASQSSSVYDVSSKQQGELLRRIEEVEAQKKSDVEQRLKAEAEHQKLRQHIASLKKKLEKADRQKTLLEDKCRTLQQKKKAAEAAQATA